MNQTELKNIKDRIDARLNDHLCDMKPDYDDSIVGFNTAWDIVRKVFAEAEATPSDGAIYAAISERDAVKRGEPTTAMAIEAVLPCKNKQAEVAVDGSCLRCGADQGEACRVPVTSEETQ